MKVMVSAVAFSPDISGIQRHAFNLVRCLLVCPEITKVDLVVGAWQTGLTRTLGIEGGNRLTTHIAEIREGSLHRNLWYYRALPQLAARLRPDLVHLSYPVPVNARSMPCPTVVTLHDLYPYEIPRNFRFPHVLLNRWILQQCLRNVDRIACVSTTTLARMRNYAPPSTWSKAVRIFNCVEPAVTGTAQTPPAALRGEPFLLSVAQHRRNKNIPLLLRVFHRLLRDRLIDAATKLVVVGIFGPETQRIRLLIASLGLADRVLLLRGLSEAELQWCYARCEALVVPSKTEGFGLPVAEALLAGCPVICSDIPAFREVGGAHCRFVRLGEGEEETLARAIQTSLCQPRPPAICLPHLAPEVLAGEYAQLYRQIITTGDTLPEGRRAPSPAPTIPAIQGPSRWHAEGPGFRGERGFDTTLP